MGKAQARFAAVSYTMGRAVASRTPRAADVVTWPGAFIVCVATIAASPASTKRRGAMAIRPAIVGDESFDLRVVMQHLSIIRVLYAVTA